MNWPARLTHLVGVPAAAIGSMWCAPLAAQVVLPDWNTVSVRAQPLGSGIYVLEGFGGNIGVSAGPDGILLVDDQYAPLTDKIRKALAAVSERPIRFVVNTHWHADHTGGNENFGTAGAVIVSHDRTRQHLSVERFNQELGKIAAPPKASLPIVTFNMTATFHMNGQTIRAVHIPPAHTDGDVIVHFVEADVIHTGDAYFNGFYPFIDVENGGSIDGMIAFYDELYAMSGAGTKIVPGHGPVANREDVRSYQTMLRTVRNRVADAISKKRSLAELIAAEPLKDLDPEWGDNLIKAPLLLDMVYRDLSRGPAGKAR